MTIANQLKSAENLPVLSTEASQPSSRPTFGLKPIFVGPNGLRAGWRLLMFLALLAFYLEASFSSEQAALKAFWRSTGTKATLQSRRLLWASQKPSLCCFSAALP